MRGDLVDFILIVECRNMEQMKRFGKIPLEQRKEIVRLRDEGLENTEICRKLFRGDNVQIPQETLSRFLKRFDNLHFTYSCIILLFQIATHGK